MFSCLGKLSAGAESVILRQIEHAASRSETFCKPQRSLVHVNTCFLGTIIIFEALTQSGLALTTRGEHPCVWRRRCDDFTPGCILMFGRRWEMFRYCGLILGNVVCVCFGRDVNEDSFIVSFDPLSLTWLSPPRRERHVDGFVSTVWLALFRWTLKFVKFVNLGRVGRVVTLFTRYTSSGNEFQRCGTRCGALEFTGKPCRVELALEVLVSLYMLGWRKLVGSYEAGSSLVGRTQCRTPTKTVKRIIGLSMSSADF